MQISVNSLLQLHDNRCATVRKSRLALVNSRGDTLMPKRMSMFASRRWQLSLTLGDIGGHDRHDWVSQKAAEPEPALKADWPHLRIVKISADDKAARDAVAELLTYRQSDLSSPYR